MEEKTTEMKEYIKVPEELSNYIQGLMYETNARKDLLTFMLRQEVMPKERVEKYHDEYVTFFTKYEMAKQEMVNEYILPKYHKDVNWRLNFSTSTLEISI